MADYLSGNTISDLSSTSSVHILKDILLISEHDRYNYTEYCSRHMSLSVILERCQHMIDYEIGIKDMAYAESADYIPAVHSHDDKYNKMYPITRDYSPVDIRDAQNYLSIGNYFIDGRVSTIYCPLTCFGNTQFIDSDLIEPIVGTVKFSANPSLTDISISSSSFDGWVYADGRTYRLSDFALSSQLKTAYGINDTQFKVPLIDRFIKADVQGKTISQHDANNTIISHSHSVDMAISGNIDASIVVPMGSNDGHGYAFHVGPQSARYTVLTNSFKATCGVNIDTGSVVTISASGSDSGYSYPSHNLMPTLVYVGKSRYQV